MNASATSIATLCAAVFLITFVIYDPNPTYEPNTTNETNTTNEPNTPDSLTDAEIDEINKKSDDFEKYREELRAGTRSILHRACSVDDMIENGGWVRSPSKRHKGNRVYFTFCGGPHVSNRWYYGPVAGQLISPG